MREMGLDDMATGDYDAYVSITIERQLIGVRDEQGNILGIYVHIQGGFD